MSEQGVENSYKTRWWVAYDASDFHIQLRHGAYWLNMDTPAGGEAIVDVGGVPVGDYIAGPFSDLNAAKVAYLLHRSTI